MENPTVGEILKAMVTSYATRALTLLAAYLTAHGLSNPAFSTANLEYLGAALGVAVIDLGILAYRKLSEHRLIEAARVARANADIEEVKRIAANTPLLGH